MIKIKLIAKHTLEREDLILSDNIQYNMYDEFANKNTTNKVENKFNVKDFILYKKDTKICKLNYKAFTTKNSLFVYQDNLINEYKITSRKSSINKDNMEFRRIFKECTHKEGNCTGTHAEDNCTGTHTEGNCTETNAESSCTGTHTEDNNKKVKSVAQRQDLYSNIDAIINTEDYKIIFRLNHYMIYKGAEKKSLSMYICRNTLLMFHDYYLVTFPCKDIVYKFSIKKDKKDRMHDIQYESINNNPKSMYRMFLYINLFVDLPVNVKNKEMNNFLYDICIFKKDLSKNINYEIFEKSIIIDLYRKLGDNSFLSNLNIFNNLDDLSFLDIKKIALCNFKCTKTFLEKCLVENKEWEIKKIIKIMKKTEFFEDIIEWLLNHNYLYYLSKIYKVETTPFMEIEKWVMKSYRNREKHNRQ